MNQRPRISLSIICLAFTCCLVSKSSVAWSQKPTATAVIVDNEQQEIFEKHIRPTLIDHCERCHGSERQRGDLRLDSREGWEKGGDTGTAIVPGDLDSLLLEVIRYEGGMDMPPKGKLPDATIQAFEKWIELGAYDPRRIQENKAVPKQSPQPVDQSFWSFQPLSVNHRSETGETNPSKTEQSPESKIDSFIRNKLQQNNLAPNQQADRETLIRRLYYDLIGLPPSVEAIRDFVQSEDPKAWANLIDNLLGRKEFGERWGRHWLDVVRFAESSGGGRTLLFPDAWRYRDYVIESFNRGTPYDQFLTEQIAGDLLSSNDHRERQRQIIATGFLLLGPTNYEMQDKDILEMDVVDEQIDTLGKATMGMTIGCARCHDHKFDPIPTADYYALAGIFKSTHSLIHSNVSSWHLVDLPMNEEQERLISQQETELSALKNELKEKQERLNSLKGKPKQAKKIDVGSINALVLDDGNAKKIGQWKASTSVPGYVGKQYIHDENTSRGEKSVIFSDEGATVGEFKLYMSFTPGNNRSSKVPVTIRDANGETTVLVNQRKAGPVHDSFVELGTFTFTKDAFAQITVANQVGQDGVVIADAIILAPIAQSSDETFPTFASTESPERRNEIETLESEIKPLETSVKTKENAAIKRPVAMAVADIAETCDIAIAIRGVASQKGEMVERGVLSAATWETFPKLETNQSGRLQLAKWLTDPKHPLTARVMANRIWYWMMGRGIVTSLDNFGSTGTKPSHPELLDYLAAELIRKNWSIKDLIKSIALSNTYRQSSDSTQSTAADPDNRLYARANRKRMRAEDLRDTLLSIGNAIDPEKGGPSIKTGTKIEYNYQFDSNRRSVYLPVFRNTLPQVFEFFDFADPNIQQGRRNESTVASQALWLMNHDLILKQAENAARELLSSSVTPDQRIDHAFLQTLGRFPTKLEREIIEEEILDPSGLGDDRVAANREVSSSVDNNHEVSEETKTDLAIDHWSMVYQTLCQSVDFLYVN